MSIRRATESDFERMWPIFQAVIAGGDTYVFAPDTPREEAFEYWFGPGATSFVAEEGDTLLGMFKLVANQSGLGSHIANASFMVNPAFQGKGTGMEMGLHCLRHARAAGYLAIQFNLVVSTNHAALHLWTKLGFWIAGTLPKAFRHRQLGYVDAHVMYRFLDDVTF